MARRSLQALALDRRAEAGGDRRLRCVDLVVDVWAEDRSGNRTRQHLGRVGGRWDRRLKRYVKPASAIALGAHPGQLDAISFFLEWLREHVAGTKRPPDQRVYSLLLAGGQRSGKTWIGVLMVVLYAIAIPGAIAWIVCPSEKDFEEIEDLLRAILPRRWYSVLGSPHFRWRTPNGSKIVLRSGNVPEKLKKGDADLILINEAQQQHERVFAIARGRIAAASGLVICAANPPTKSIGQWVGEFAVEAQAGQRQARYYHMDPMDNPHIDLGPLLALQKEVDEHTFNVEIRGMFLGAQNAVLYNWSRTENERPTPATGEITREVLRHFEGREFDRAVAVDVQRLPHMASAEFRFFVNPLTAGHPPPVRMQWCLMWATSDCFLKGADEEELAQAWLTAGWDPARTLVICDASGAWQFAQRDPLKVKELRQKVSGRGSFDVFRKMGFIHVVKPDRAMEKNPDVVERCRAATSRVSTKVPGPFGQRFLFSDPRCKDLNKSIRNWPIKHGVPDRVSVFSHGGDVLTYAVQRFYPRRLTPAELPQVAVLKRLDSGDRMRGW